MKRFFRLLLLPLTAVLAASCVTEDVPDNTPSGNFDALWQTLDRRYCFFALKREQYGLDWDEVGARLRPEAEAARSREALFDVCTRAVRELRDGHVSLHSSADVGRYGEWFEAYAANYSDTLERALLGRVDEYRQAGGLKYKRLDDNVGYVRCASFASAIGESNLRAVVDYLAACDGLIVDVRSNSGGLLTAAARLAGLFVGQRTLGGYVCHKTGPAHDAFSAPEPVWIDPVAGARWPKPVVVLANRRTYSAAHAFVMYVRGLPGVCVAGDTTGGGSGMPFTAELPCGWTLRFSAVPLMDRHGRHTEAGIAPDVAVALDAADAARSVDTMVETARRLLRGM